MSLQTSDPTTCITQVVARLWRCQPPTHDDQDHQGYLWRSFQPSFQTRLWRCFRLLFTPSFRLPHHVHLTVWKTGPSDSHEETWAEQKIRTHKRFLSGYRYTRLLEEVLAITGGRMEVQLGISLYTRQRSRLVENNAVSERPRSRDRSGNCFTFQLFARLGSTVQRLRRNLPT